MKKVFFFAVAMAMFSGMAQTQFKPEKGNFTTELQFRPFSFVINGYDESIKTSPFSIDGFSFRGFVNEKFAIRANIKLDYGVGKTSDDVDRKDNDYHSTHTMGTTYLRRGMFAIGIAPGFEYHFGKSDRLSIYTGVDLFFGITKYNYEQDDDLTVTITDPYYGHEIVTRTQLEMSSNSAWPYLDYQNSVSLNERSHFTFGASAFLGIDFYIYKGLYVGAELGLSYQHYAYMKAKVNGKRTTTTTDTYGTTEDILWIDYKTTNKSSFDKLNFVCEPAIRLGWKF